ncbi:MAG: plasmid mobilization relaxosome protein MobC [Pleurocapsa sp. MO_192.B19]|nr:plasmid mobilization relaxosome protein MobC [Pleurocapsa sp. MO_192.B19]
MPEPENKTKIVSFRFRPSQLEELDVQAKAVNLTRSAYVTRKLSGQSVLPARVPAVNWQLYGELASISSSLPAIGNNINQIAKALNTAKKKGEAIPQYLPKPESLEYALELIETTRETLREVRLALSGVKQNDDINK